MKNKNFKDDGRTIARMDLDGMERPNLIGTMFGARFNKRNIRQEQANNKQNDFAEIKMTKGEKRAIFKAVTLFTLQVCCVVGSLFLLIFLLMKLWLGV